MIDICAKAEPNLNNFTISKKIELENFTFRKCL